MSPIFAATAPWRRDFALVVTGTFLVAGAFFFLLPVLPLLVVGPLGGGEAQVGLVVGTFSITALAIRPFSGWMLDRFGRRVWLLGATVSMVACLAAYALVGALWELELLRLVHGLFWGLGSVAMATVAADLVPAEHRGTGMGLYGLAMPLGMSIGPLVGVAVLGEARFQWVFLTGAVITAVAAVSYAMVRVPGVRDLSARLHVVRMFEGRVIPISVVMTLLCVGLGGWLAFIPLYAPQVGLDGAGALFFWYAVGGLSSRLFIGRWYDLRGPTGPAAATVATVLLGWMGFLWAHTPLPVLLASGVLGMGFGMAGTVFLSMAIDLVQPGRRGAANATFFSAYDVGIGGGSMLFGYLVDMEHVPIVFAVAAACSVLAAGILLAYALPQFKRNRLGV